MRSSQWLLLLSLWWWIMTKSAPSGNSSPLGGGRCRNIVSSIQSCLCLLVALLTRPLAACQLNVSRENSKQFKWALPWWLNWWNSTKVDARGLGLFLHPLGWLVLGVVKSGPEPNSMLHNGAGSVSNVRMALCFFLRPQSKSRTSQVPPHLPCRWRAQIYTCSLLRHEAFSLSWRSSGSRRFEMSCATFAQDVIHFGRPRRHSLVTCPRQCLACVISVTYKHAARLRASWWVALAASRASANFCICPS